MSNIQLFLYIFAASVISFIFGFLIKRDVTNFRRIRNITIEGDHNSVEVKNGKVYIDGVAYVSGGIGDNQVVVECFEIHGSVGCVTSGSGDVKIDDYVSGPVTTGSGDIDIGGDVRLGVKSSSGDVTVKGNVGSDICTSSGDVEVGGKVEGKVNTASGNIRLGV